MKSTYLLRKLPGNSLMEYALPAVIILLVAGVLSTIFDIHELIGDYFRANSGHTRADMQGTTLNVNVNSKDLSGTTGDGSDGFTERVVITDGNGRSVDLSDGTGAYYRLGPISGTPGPKVSGGNGIGRNVDIGAGIQNQGRTSRQDNLVQDQDPTDDPDADYSRPYKGNGGPAAKDRPGLSKQPQVAGTRGQDDEDVQRF